MSLQLRLISQRTDICDMHLFSECKQTSLIIISWPMKDKHGGIHVAPPTNTLNDN